MIQPLPAEAYQLAEAYHLGTPRAVYRVQFTRSDLLISLYMLISVLISLAMLAFLIIFITLILTSQLHSNQLFPWFFFIFPAAFLPNLISFFLIRPIRRINQPVVYPFMRNLRVYTCTGGLIRLRNRKPNIIRWDQIKRVRYFHRNSMYKSTMPIVIVYRNDEKMFTPPQAVCSAIATRAVTLKRAAKTRSWEPSLAHGQQARATNHSNPPAS